jgi:hypothetical protein
MRFRDFIIKEETGLGDLGSKMDKIFNNPHFARATGAYLSTDQSGTEQGETLGSSGHPLYLPSTDITIPNVEIVGRVKILDWTKNPIYIELSDGTKAHFTYEEFRRIKNGPPAVGKMMTIIFQRHPEDRGQEFSKIERATVIDN